MTATRLLAASVATGALCLAAPAMAHPVADGPVVYESDPVVQPVPGSAPVPVPEWSERMEESMPAPPPMPAVGPHGHAHTYHHAMPAHPGYAPMPPRFDRGAWLAECRERIRGVDRKDRGGVIGGLLGAIAGGVAGNRLWDSRRLAGTLLGAGVGGLAGAAIGSAVAASGDRDRDDECADYLDRYMAGGYGSQGYGYPGYGYGYGYSYAYPAFAYVPVMVQVPQRAIVRETVTEEWVTVPGAARTVTPTKTIRYAPAPAPSKRTKLIKGR